MIVLQTIISKSKMGRTYRGKDRKRLVEDYKREREKREKKRSYDDDEDDKKKNRWDDYDDRRYNWNFLDVRY